MCFDKIVVVLDKLVYLSDYFMFWPYESSNGDRVYHPHTCRSWPPRVPDGMGRSPLFGLQHTILYYNILY